MPKNNMPEKLIPKPHTSKILKPKNPMPETLHTDEQLFRKCQHYGSNSKFWHQKFLGLLPEVQKRNLHEKKGFDTILEFAVKLAGASERQVRLALSLQERFASTPALQTLLINGEVSINKLARVASIATPENQEVLAEQAKILSKSALETLVRDEKFAQNQIKLSQELSSGDNYAHDYDGNIDSLEDSYGEPLTGFKPLPGQKSRSINDDLELMQHLSENLKTRLTAMTQKGINIGELLNNLLDQHEAQILQEKLEFAEEQSLKQQLKQNNTSSNKTTPSRHIPVKIRRVLTKEHGTKCTIQSCQKPSKTLHHTQRFALSQIHDPHFLAPLCADHHQIAHSIDQQYTSIRRSSG